MSHELWGFTQCSMNYEAFQSDCWEQALPGSSSLHCSMKTSQAVGRALQELTSSASLNAHCPFWLEVQLLESHWFIYFVLSNSCFRYWMNLAFLILSWLKLETLGAILLNLILSYFITCSLSWTVTQNYVGTPGTKRNKACVELNTSSWEGKKCTWRGEEYLHISKYWYRQSTLRLRATFWKTRL